MASQRDSGGGENEHCHDDSSQRSQRDRGQKPAGERHVDSQPDRAIASIAGLQHAIVTRPQLIGLGLRPSTIDNWVNRGRLHLMHRGVYALVAHAARPPLAPQLAAVFACGDLAVLSHHSAAALWGLRPLPAGDIDVTIVGRHCRSRQGIRVHRSSSLDARDIRRYKRIPLTSAARTIVDIATDLPTRDLERAFDEALVQRLVTRHSVGDAIRRAPPRKGRAALKKLALTDTATTATRSQAEERFLSLIRRAGLPRPEVNARLGRYEVDFLWRDARLVVEVDGYAFHSSRTAFERDRRRDAELEAAGFRVIRVTWWQLMNEPEALLVSLVRALALASGTLDRS